MGFNFNLSFGRSYQPESIEIDSRGNVFYELWNNLFKANKIKCAETRYKAVMDNPAVLLNLKLIADMGSLVRIHEYKDNNIQTTDFLYTKKKYPNFFQSWEQFFKDFYLWANMGTAYLYDPSKGELNDSDQLYWLIPNKLDFSKEQKEALGGFVASQTVYNKLMATNVKYTQPNGKTIPIPLKHIKPFFSFSNGLSGNWFDGGSYLDSLYKIITNSDLSLNSQAVNLDKSKEFLVSKKESKDSLNEFATMGDAEKEDVERKLVNGKTFTVSKAPVNIQRIVSDLQNLKLDETFLTQYFIIGKMFGIPKDVSEAYLNNGATFENQDKSMIKFISTSLQPLMDSLVSHFNYNDLRATWEHLPIYQTASKERAERRKIELENLALAVELGLSESDKKNYLKEIMQ